MEPMMTFADYCGLKGMNWSLLKKLRDGSPLHLKHAIDNPDESDSDTFRVGRAFHTLVLEPEKFDDAYVMWPKRRQGKEWDAFEAAAEAEGKTVLTSGQEAKARAMAKYTRNHPLVRPYLRDGSPEHTMVWNDPATGIKCKGRADWLSYSMNAVVDLKTARCTDARRFGRQAASLGYHCQGAHYLQGARALRLFGNADPSFVIIAVEHEAPYDVTVYRMDPAVEIAAREGADGVDALLARVAECMATNHWPGRYEAEQALDLPAWVFADESDEDPEAMGFTATA
jgi:hypothetical protein